MGLMRANRNSTFIGIVVLMHIFYFVLACLYTRIYMGDSFEYIYEAINIKERFFFYSGNPALPVQPEYMTQRQPIYPLFLLFVYLFTVNNWLVLLLQNVLSVCNILYARRLFFSMAAGPRFQWGMLAFLLLTPSQFINANTIAPDILLQTFTLLYFGCGVGVLRLPNIRQAAFMSLWLVCGMLVKPVLYPFVLVHLLLIIVVFARHRARMQRPFLIAMMPVLAVLLYNYSNYTRTGKFHFSSNQAFNAVFYYYPYVTAHYGQDSASAYLAQQRVAQASISDYSQRYDYANAQGTKMLKDNLFPYLLFHFKHSLRIIIEPGKAELDLFTGRLTYGGLYTQSSSGFYATLSQQGIAGAGSYIRSNPSLPLILLVLVGNLIRLLGLVLFLARAAIPRSVRLFVAVCIGYFALASGPISNTRYFLPVVLIAIGCAAYAISTTKDKSILPS